jgi:uncharacterized protein (TIGR03089 family)
VQLGSVPTRRARPPDLAAALRSARQELGHRPAVTVLRPDRREEQGFASLAQWAAKGAHLLELDLLLEPGDALALAAPLGWTSAAVALAAWWSGVSVALGAEPGGATVAVVEEGRVPPDGAEEVFWLGAGVDGAPLGPVPGEPWAQAVQSFPDQPPAPRAAAELTAVVAGGRRWTHAELLALVEERLPDQGTLGLDRSAALPATLALAAVAVRPLVVGRPTVVLRDVERGRADGEKVAVWA